MRQGRVVQPEGNRGILLTEWRPDRLHRPHSPCLGNHFFLIHPSLHCSLPVDALRSPPSTFNLASFIPPSPSPVAISASPFPTKATCLLAHPSPTPCLLLRLPLATRHSQMSAGSCITETARLSAVVTWHLKAVRAWDTVASHSTLIAVY